MHVSVIGGHVVHCGYYAYIPNCAGYGLILLLYFITSRNPGVKESRKNKEIMESRRT